MISYFNGRKKSWNPDNFALYEKHYPQTEWTPVSSSFDRSQNFQLAWHQQLRLPLDYSLVLTPGLFAEWIPHCFKGPRLGFQKQGHRCLQTPVATQHGVNTQAERIESSVCQWLEPGEKFIWCTHSKGGIDALWALEHSIQLQQHCAGIVMVQIPVGYSWVIKDIQHSNKLADKLTHRIMKTRWLHNGINAITKNGDEALKQWLSTHQPKVPAIHAVSWSIKATSWADSWHKRLTKLRPQHAHDGQFFLQDQRLNTLPVVCLPALDHAQPVLGGNALDTNRLWTALAHTVLNESHVEK